MAITGSSWDLVNYLGELFTASRTKTPILSAAGDMAGANTVQTDQFPLSVEYSLPAAGQNVRSENDAVTAPTAVDVTTSQTVQAIQIMQHAIQVTYKTQSNMNKITGIADTNMPMAISDWVDFQIARKIDVIKRDMEYSAINGTYVANTGETIEGACRGLLEAISDASNGVAAAGADLSKTLITRMLKEAYDDGAQMGNMALYVNSYQKTVISSIYEYVPADRFLGGSNIQAIETDFGKVSVELNSFMPTDTVLLVELNDIKNVFQPVPKKGLIFYEDLGKAGAATTGHLYTQWSFDYGPSFDHNAITGLATS